MRECFDKYTDKVLEVANVGKVYLEMLYINSKVNFYNRQAAELEASLNEVQINFATLDKSMKHLELPFPDFFANLDKEETKTGEQYNDFHEINFEKGLGKNNQTVLTKIERNQMDVSERIENMILKITGNINIYSLLLLFKYNLRQKHNHLGEDLFFP